MPTLRNTLVRKSLVRVVLALLCALIALGIVPNLVYNACGLAGMQDCADGPKWMLVLNVLLSAIVFGGSLFLSYRLFRRKNPSDRSNRSTQQPRA